MKLAPKPNPDNARIRAANIARVKAALDALSEVKVSALSVNGGWYRSSDVWRRIGDPPLGIGSVARLLQELVTSGEYEVRRFGGQRSHIVGYRRKR